METFAQLLATGEPCLLALAVVAFIVSGVLGALAVRLRPRR
jgi:hypothetical protein